MEKCDRFGCSLYEACKFSNNDRIDYYRLTRICEENIGEEDLSVLRYFGPLSMYPRETIERWIKNQQAKDGNNPCFELIENVVS